MNAAARELLPCPFCGGDAAIKNYRNFAPLVSVCCENPACQVWPDVEALLDVACETWNKRATLTPQQGGEGGGVRVAGELLAAEYERDGWPIHATAIRNGELTSSDDRAVRAIATALRSKQAAPSEGEVALQRAYWLGWRNSAARANRKDLWADSGSQAYLQERNDDLRTLAALEKK
jgi:hypothetical protein